MSANLAMRYRRAHPELNALSRLGWEPAAGELVLVKRPGTWTLGVALYKQNPPTAHWCNEWVVGYITPDVAKNEWLLGKVFRTNELLPIVI